MPQDPGSLVDFALDVIKDVTAQASKTYKALTETKGAPDPNAKGYAEVALAGAQILLGLVEFEEYELHDDGNDGEGGGGSGGGGGGLIPEPFDQPVSRVKAHRAPPSKLN